MLIFVLWPKMKIENKQELLCSFSIIISYLSGRLVSRNPRFSEDISDSHSKTIGMRRLLLAVDPPVVGSLQSVGDENVYFDVLYQTAISNARCNGNLASYGRGSGRGSENTVLPPARFYPSQQ